MRDHSTTETLERIVGPERAQHLPRVVARAQRELSLRGGTEEAAFQRKVRLSGTICAVIGAFCVVWPLVLLTIFSIVDLKNYPSNADLPFMFRHFNQIFIAVGILQTVVGALLLSGGLLIRSRKPSGPRFVTAALYIVLFYIVAFTATLIPSFGPTGDPFAVVFVLMGLFNAFVWGFAFWFPFRFFRSPRVRQAHLHAAV